MKRNQYTYAVYARATRRRSTVCIRNIPEAYPCVLPSYRFEIGDFEIKDESAERSLGLSGVYLPPRKVQNVPKDETKVHIISIRAKKKREKFAFKQNFLPKDFPESGISKAWEYPNLTSKPISKLPSPRNQVGVFQQGCTCFSGMLWVWEK